MLCPDLVFKTGLQLATVFKHTNFEFPRCKWRTNEHKGGPLGYAVEYILILGFRDGCSAPSLTPTSDL